jgi:hypothetical protein
MHKMGRAAARPFHFYALAVPRKSTPEKKRISPPLPPVPQAHDDDSLARIRIDPCETKHDENLLEHPRERSAAVFTGRRVGDFLVVEALDVVLLAVAPSFAALEFLEDLQSGFESFGADGESPAC